MISKSIKRCLVAVSAMVFLHTSLALGGIDSIDVEITNGRYLLNDDSTDARLLFAVDVPTELLNAEIHFAELFVPLTAYIPDSSALQILTHPLIISWDGNTSWGDLGDSLTGEVISGEGTHFATSVEGAQEANFDITDIVMAWREGRITNNGLILFCSSDELPYFGYRRNQDFPFARVRIYHR